jgi:hypothetical protein
MTGRRNTHVTSSLPIYRKPAPTPASPPSSIPSGLQANVIGFAIRFRGIVLGLALVLLGYGVLSVVRAKYDVFPEFAPPQVGIQTEAPGLTSEQIEVLVTQPIENAINGVPGVQSLARPTHTEKEQIAAAAEELSATIQSTNEIVITPDSWPVMTRVPVSGFARLVSAG